MKVSENDSKQTVDDLEKAVSNLNLNEQEQVNWDSKKINIITSKVCVTKEETLTKCLEVCVRVNQGSDSQNCASNLSVVNNNTNTSIISTSLGALSLLNEGKAEPDCEASGIRKRGPERTERFELVRSSPYSSNHLNGTCSAISTNGKWVLSSTQNKSEEERIQIIKNFLKDESYLTDEQYLTGEPVLPDLEVLLEPNIINLPQFASEFPDTSFNNFSSPNLFDRNSQHDSSSSNISDCNIESRINLEQSLSESRFFVEKTLPIPVPQNSETMSDNQNSPQSTSSIDTGYNTDRSSTNSPIFITTTIIGSRGSVPILPNFATNLINTEVNQVNNSSETMCRRIPRNKFMENFNEKIRDTKHRSILKKGRQYGLNIKDDENKTLLHIAIEQKDEVYAVVFINMLQKSFQHSGRKNGLASYKDLLEFLNQQDNKGFTPLLTACAMNLPMIVEYLLECGVDPSLTEKLNGESPLHYVCKRGKRYTNVLEKLCQKVDPNLPNLKGETPLHYAVTYHMSKHNDENTGLEEVCDNDPLIKVLLSNNAKLASQDENGRTPLHWLIFSKNLGLLKCLLSQANDFKMALNMQNIQGRTALHEAVRFDGDVLEQKILVQTLIVWEASQKIPDNDGKFPKDFVTESKRFLFDVLNPQVVQFLDWMSHERRYWSLAYLIKCLFGMVLYLACFWQTRFDENTCKAIYEPEESIY